MRMIPLTDHIGFDKEVIKLIYRIDIAKKKTGWSIGGICNFIHWPERTVSRARQRKLAKQGYSWWFTTKGMDVLGSEIVNFAEAFHIPIKVTAGNIGRAITPHINTYEVVVRACDVKHKHIVKEVS